MHNYDPVAEKFNLQNNEKNIKFFADKKKMLDDGIKELEDKRKNCKDTNSCELIDDKIAVEKWRKDNVDLYLKTEVAKKECFNGNKNSCDTVDTLRKEISTNREKLPVIGTGSNNNELKDGRYTNSSPSGKRKVWNEDKNKFITQEHYAQDQKVPVGTPIVTWDDGVVIKAKSECKKGTSGLTCNNGAGFYTKIEHENGITTRQLHQSVVFVQDGDKVKKGQVIGLSGNTGNSTGPHLHREVYDANGKRLDPANYKWSDKKVGKWLWKIIINIS